MSVRFIWSNGSVANLWFRSKDEVISMLSPDKVSDRLLVVEDLKTAEIIYHRTIK